MAPPPSLAHLLELAAQTSGAPIQLGLERVEQLLDRLGNPQNDLRCIHVAGTNGKGSVIAFLEAILLAAGWQVAAYTSPHLSHFTERIRFNGQPVADEEIAGDLAHILALDEAGETTYFERTTAAAFCCFQRHAPDWVLLETGLGGRLDATNVVTPRLSLITPIGLDHQEYLGDTLLEIAWEKAGILKPGVPAVADPGHRKAEAVLRVTAAGRRVPLLVRGREYDYKVLEDGWILKDPGGTLTLPTPALAGLHQIQNAALAVAGLRCLNHPTLSREAIHQGLTRASWPGRLERMAGTPPIWLDGAHNPQAALALAAALPTLAPPPFTVVFATMADKDHQAMVQHLAPLTREVHLCPMDTPRSADPAVLAAAWHARDIPAYLHPSPMAALTAARQRTPRDGHLLVTGSLYLIGALRPHIV